MECPNCGMEAKIGSMFCEKCGTNLEVYTNPEICPKCGSHRSKKKSINGIILFFIIVTILNIIFPPFNWDFVIFAFIIIINEIFIRKKFKVYFILILLFLLTLLNLLVFTPHRWLYQIWIIAIIIYYLFDNKRRVITVSLFIILTILNIIISPFCWIDEYNIILFSIYFFSSKTHQCIDCKYIYKPKVMNKYIKKEQV